jgi:hypothetical protein
MKAHEAVDPRDSFAVDPAVACSTGHFYLEEA